MENKQVTTGGANVFTLLLVLFVGLKLAGIGVVAGWSWWWVLSPLWAPFAGIAVVFIGIFLAAFVRGIADEVGQARRARRVRKAKEKAREAEVKAVDAAMAAERKLRNGEVK